MSSVESRASRAVQSDGVSGCWPSTAFSLIEVMVVVTLLSVIVLALMAVFTSTQSAFRAAATQADVLEGGRAAMDLMADDLRQLTPSGGTSNGPINNYYFTSDVNFFANTNVYYYSPLVQSLVASSDSRTNVLEYFFILSRENVKGRDNWVGTGYAVDLFATNFLYPLYRFNTNALVTTTPPWLLFSNFMASVAMNDFTSVSWSHLIDGVVDLRVRAYDPRGTWISDRYGAYTNAQNVLFLQPVFNEVGLAMFGSTVPAAVDINLGILEDRTIQRAESIGNSLARSNYLSSQAGKVHVFRQRVTIPNLDPSAYQ